MPLCNSEPILKFPDLNQPFIVEVDASNHAVGGILSQKGLIEQLHPVAYFSTALRKDQKKLVCYQQRSFCLSSCCSSLERVFSWLYIYSGFRS